MGWSVHYRAVIDGVVSGADRDLLVEQTAKWTALLHEGSESYWWEILDAVKAARIFGRYDPTTAEFVPAPIDPEKSYLWGFTKVQYSEDAAADFCTLIGALRELAEARSTWRITVSDDYYLTDVDPREVAAPAALLED